MLNSINKFKLSIDLYTKLHPLPARIACLVVTMRRKQVAFASEIKTIGNGFFIPISKKDVERMGLSPGDDVDVTVSLPEMVDYPE